MDPGVWCNAVQHLTLLLLSHLIKTYTEDRCALNWIFFRFYQFSSGNFCLSFCPESASQCEAIYGCKTQYLRGFFTARRQSEKKDPSICLKVTLDLDHQLKIRKVCETKLLFAHERIWNTRHFAASPLAADQDSNTPVMAAATLLLLISYDSLLLLISASATVNLPALGMLPACQPVCLLLSLTSSSSAQPLFPRPLSASCCQPLPAPVSCAFFLLSLVSPSTSDQYLNYFPELELNIWNDMTMCSHTINQ